MNRLRNDNPPTLIEDGYLQEPEREPYAGWDLEPTGTPIPVRIAWLGLGLCIGVVVGVVLGAGL